MLKTTQRIVVTLLLIIGMISLYMSVMGFITLITVGVTPGIVLKSLLAALICYLSFRFAYVTLHSR